MQVSDQVIDFRSNFWKFGFGRDFVSLTDVPVSNSGGPFGEVSASHRSVFRLAHGNDESRVRKIFCGEFGGFGWGKRAGYSGSVKTICCPMRQVFGRKVRSKASRLHLPMQTVFACLVIKPRLRMTAAVEITGAEKEKSLANLHSATLPCKG